MQTIVILLDPGKLIKPDLDLRYLIPDRIEAVSYTHSGKNLGKYHVS